MVSDLCSDIDLSMFSVSDLCSDIDFSMFKVIFQLIMKEAPLKQTFC